MKHETSGHKTPHQENWRRRACNVFLVVRGVGAPGSTVNRGGW